MIPRGLVLIAAAACGGPLAPGDLAPAFSLVDTNPASPSFDESLGQGTVTAHVKLWYFGHAN